MENAICTYKLAFVVGTIMVATAVSIVVYVNNEKKMDDLFSANVEALTEVENIGDFMEKYFGCNGGQYQCFSGTVSFKGASISGTWYQRD